MPSRAVSPGWCCINTDNSCSKLFLYFFHASWITVMLESDFMYHKIDHTAVILESNYEISIQTF